LDLVSHEHILVSERVVFISEVLVAGLEIENSVVELLELDVHVVFVVGQGFFSSQGILQSSSASIVGFSFSLNLDILLMSEGVKVVSDVLGINLFGNLYSKLIEMTQEDVVLLTEKQDSISQVMDGFSIDASDSLHDFGYFP
jgi:hypothetical protein